MLRSTPYPDDLHVRPGEAAPIANFAAGKRVYVADVRNYDLDRSLLYALGAVSVANRMMPGIDLVLHGGAPPQKARSKYPSAAFVRADELLPLFHQEIRSFADYVRALQAHGFTVRNPSDEGDPAFDFFEAPLVDGSLQATLLDYLGRSAFIRKIATRQHFPIDAREPAYVDFTVPGGDGIVWYYLWHSDAWARVSAQRGEGDHPLEIKGSQLMAVAPALWRESAGLYFYEYPHVDSITGLFIQAGIDARSGLCHGAAISRVWT